jgi:8-oxo-dGTP diphosphatase
MTTQARPIVQVAVGVLIKDHQYVLMGKRPQGKPFAGYWEFPGGKIEPNESLMEALARELKEELGIKISCSGNLNQPLMILEHDYPHAYVRLHICIVYSWDGEPSGLENQELSWQDLFKKDLSVSPVLPAAWPMIDKLRAYLNQAGVNTIS